MEGSPASSVATQNGSFLQSSISRVLVVDDQAFVRRILKDILVKNGVKHVTEAANGRDAISHLSAPAAAFDLVFCDLQMPDMDGIETIRAISEMNCTTPLVLMSGEDTEIIETAATL